MYRKGLFLTFSNNMHQIEAIMKQNSTLIFLCTKFSTEKFYDFANSFKIKKSNETSLIKYDQLVCKRSYEGKPLHNQTHIIADNVDMIPIYANFIV